MVARADPSASVVSVEIAGGSPSFPFVGFVGGFFFFKAGDWRGWSVVPAGLGCRRGGGAEWLEGVERHPANSGTATTV